MANSAYIAMLAIAGGLAFSAPSLALDTTTYTYDELGRVTTVTPPAGSSTTYQYDSANNRTGASSSSGATVIQVTSISNLRTLANNAGYTGSTSANFQFIVPAGTTIYGSSGDGTGINTGTWPAGVTLSLVVNGNVYGRGGTGGIGAGYYGSSTAGTAGGDAIYCQAPIAITINSGGTVKGGGDGGHGGTNMVTYNAGPGGTLYFGAGGGGGGFPSGIGGSGGRGANGGGNGSDGGNGTTSGGGAGGAGASSPGTTSPGSPGGGAGSSGFAVRKNGNSVPVTNNGTVAGTSA